MAVRKQRRRVFIDLAFRTLTAGWLLFRQVVAERRDITAITKSACDIVEKTKFKDTMHAYSVLLATEKSICEVCAAENKKASLGSQNLLQAIADKSEMRQYKIQRRIKDV